ncbi:MAG: C10 family peptidase [Clostridia bacterium]|nr:C10 family peptidase [Clostridia bacterium]MCD8295533.1 C10 family peptidase [Clostridia bacterium]
MAVLALCSCTDMAELDTAQVSDAVAIDALVQAAVSSDAVTLDDIRSIATATSGKTRNSSTAYSISSIDDAEGNPAIYVINFENNKGFILVSATKNYLPVLAYSDTGSFTVSEEMPEGLKMWKEETVSTIEYVNTLPEDSVAKYRDCWRQYEEPVSAVSSSNSVSTLSVSDSELSEAQAIVMEFSLESMLEGYDILDVTGEMTGDNALDEEIRDFIQGYIYPLYEEEWTRLCVVRRKSLDNTTTVDNFMETVWEQDFGYNDSFPVSNEGVKAVAGCGPVAAGQIMYYYKYPASFDWEGMYPDCATTATSDLLLDVANKANAVFWSNDKNDTSTTIDDIDSALKSYGYTTTMGDHDAATAWKNIQSKIPVYMRANDSNDEGNAHAWVASGGKYSMTYTSYEVYTFTSRLRFVNAATYRLNYFLIYYFYMNWGRYGASNGFYIDNNLIGALSYSPQNRKDIYDITPQ